MKIVSESHATPNTQTTATIPERNTEVPPTDFGGVFVIMQMRAPAQSMNI